MCVCVYVCVCVWCVYIFWFFFFFLRYSMHMSKQLLDYDSSSLSINKYWVGQKVHLGFSKTSYGKPEWTLTNSIISGLQPVARLSLGFTENPYQYWRAGEGDGDFTGRGRGAGGLKSTQGQHPPIPPARPSQRLSPTQVHMSLQQETQAVSWERVLGRAPGLQGLAGGGGGTSLYDNTETQIEATPGWGGWELTAPQVQCLFRMMRNSGARTW